MIPRCLALDIGAARVGVAVNVGELVLPRETISRSELPAWLAENSPSFDVCLVGLPLNLQGELAESASAIIDLVAAIEFPTGLQVRFSDERMTTSVAQQKLRQSGRNVKNSRGIIDAQAAAEILEHAIRANPDRPGRDLDEYQR